MVPNLTHFEKCFQSALISSQILHSTSVIMRKVSDDSKYNKSNLLMSLWSTLSYVEKIQQRGNYLIDIATRKEQLIVHFTLQSNVSKTIH